MSFPSNRQQLLQNIWALDRPPLLDHIGNDLSVEGSCSPIPLRSLARYPVKFSFLSGLILYEGDEDLLSSAWDILPPRISEIRIAREPNSQTHTLAACAGYYNLAYQITLETPLNELNNLVQVPPNGYHLSISTTTQEFRDSILWIMALGRIGSRGNL